VNAEKQEIDFSLAVSDGRPLGFIAKIGVAEQIISGLGRMVRDLRQPKPQMTAAEDVAEYLVQRDAFGGPVLLRFVTPHGVPYTFALPAVAASDIAERLKTESQKERPVGRA
jgi:hypothetical protein